MADDEVDSTLSEETINKYSQASIAVNKALKSLLSDCKIGALISNICEKGDDYIRKHVSAPSNPKKKKTRGVAFPTCLSVNNIVCHYSPLSSDDTALKENDILKIDMGCQVDGYIAVVAHTHVLQQGPVTGKRADVIKAAATAAEVALKLMRPRHKNHEVTEACNKVAAAYQCRMVKTTLSHQMTQGVIDGPKVILSVPRPGRRVADAEFKENEVYAIDIVMSTGDGELERAEEHNPTIFRLKEAVDSLYGTNRKFYYLHQDFGCMPFSARGLNTSDISEYREAPKLQKYYVLREKQRDAVVAHIKFTVLVLPNESKRITGLGLQELEPVLTPHIEEFLNQYVEDPNKKKKKKKNQC